MLQTCMLLADGGMSVTDLAPAASVVGSLGFAVWYAWWVTTVSIPKLLSDHRAERESWLTRFEKQLSDQRADFSKLLIDQRADFNTDTKSLLAETKEQRGQFATWMRRGKADQA